MPLFMDRHDIPKEITAEHVAKMHQEDLKVEHLYGCRGITYWCDEKRGTAFCLFEAPNKEALQRMHDHAHGEYPHQIIQVDESLVASFLGRIKDPDQMEFVDGIPVIDDSSYRGIMIIETNDFLRRLEGEQFSLFNQKFHKSVMKTLSRFRGSIVKQSDCYYLVSFKSITNSVFSALKIQENFKDIVPKYPKRNYTLNIGIHSGTPINSHNTIFGEVISLASRMCEYIPGTIVVSSEVNQLYTSENKQRIINDNQLKILKPKQEQFLTKFLDYLEKVWNHPNLNVETLSKTLGYSKSQIYRKVIGLTNKSPNSFIREFKLNKSLELLKNGFGSISEVAFECGFNSPAYYTKCFQERFGLLPSTYARQ